MEKIICYTDGGARGNPGPAGIGVYAVDAAGEVQFEYKQVIGETTNNVAEYQAVIEALRLLKENFSNIETDWLVEFRLDSELVVKQILGQYRVKEPTLQGLHAQIKEKIALFSHINFIHVPRAQNKEADRLVNEALDEQ